MLTHIHHINFIVRDLDASIERYKALLGVNDDAFLFDDLPARNVSIARIKLGQTWLVLVQPKGEEGIPAAHLRKHGEGLFLLSLACPDLDLEVHRLNAEQDMVFASPERKGLDDWRVQDLETSLFSDVQIQLTQASKDQ